MVFLDSLGAAARSVDKGGGLLGWSLWRPLLFVALALSIDLVLPIAALFYDPLAAAFGVAALSLATLTHAIISAHLGNPMRGALLWPIGHVVNMVLTLRSALRAWRNQGVYWRDTFYPRQVVERGRRIEIPSLRVTVRPSQP
jgi:hypothetical protein